MTGASVVDSEYVPYRELSVFDAMLDKGLYGYSQYVGIGASGGIESGKTYIPGMLQTEDYARKAVDWSAYDHPAWFMSWTIGQRLTRLDRLIDNAEYKGGNPDFAAELYIHEAVADREDVPPHVLATAFRHIGHLVYDVGDDRLNVRVVEAERHRALADDGNLAASQNSIIIGLTPSARLVVVEDGSKYIGPGVALHEHALVLHQRLGEVALSTEDSLGWLNQRATLIENR